MSNYDEISFNLPAPIANVTLKDLISPQTIADVLLLIDTGADVTLLPKSAVDKFQGLELSNEDYQLEDFDGSRSKAVAVQLQLIFLNKKITGNFLLIEQEIGILGRDILNYLSIIFDGKKLQWSGKSKE